MLEHLSAMGEDINIGPVGSKDVKRKVWIGACEYNTLELWQLILHFQFELVICKKGGPFLGLVFPP